MQTNTLNPKRMIASAFHGFADSMNESYPSQCGVTMEKRIGLVRAGTGIGGVRPSSGAASADRADASSLMRARLPPYIAAPEDGRTPPMSLATLACWPGALFCFR